MQNEPPACRRLQQRKNHTLTRIRLERFTAFEHLDLNLSPGINVFIGANGTGKTHLLKVAYSACDFNVIESEIIMPERHFREKLTRVFLPYRNDIGRLVKHSGAYHEGVVEVWYGDQQFRVAVSKRGTGGGSLHNLGWPYGTIKSVFIPAKEVLANAPGFRSLYRQREIPFEETYSDILDRAYLPALREDIDDDRSRLVDCLETAVGGRVTVAGEEFFLSPADPHPALGQTGSLPVPEDRRGVRLLLPVQCAAALPGQLSGTGVGQRGTQPHSSRQQRPGQIASGHSHRLPRYPERLQRSLRHRRGTDRKLVRGQPARQTTRATRPLPAAARSGHRRSRISLLRTRRRQRPVPHRQRTPPAWPSNAVHHQQASADRVG